jgi:hypothetical protein
MDVLVLLASPLIGLLLGITTHTAHSTSTNAGNDPLANPECGWLRAGAAWEGHLHRQAIMELPLAGSLIFIMASTMVVLARQGLQHI